VRIFMLPVEHGAVTLQTGAAIVGSFGAITEFVEIAPEPKVRRRYSSET